MSDSDPVNSTNMIYE